MRLGVLFLAVIALQWLSALGAPAQVPPPPTQDPLMSLMLAQPRMDFEAPVFAEATIDPPVVRVGELAIYRVSINALEDTIAWPTNFPAPAGLEIRAGGHGQVLQMSVTNMQPRTTFNYRVRANKPGEFTFAEHPVRVNGKEVRIPPAVLTVVSNNVAPVSAPAQQLALELPTNNIYLGQSLKARVILPGGAGGIIQGLMQVQFQGQGFITDQTSVRQMVEVRPRPGMPGGMPVLIYETTVTPLQAGSLEVFAQGFTAGNRFSGAVIITGPAVIPGGMPQYLLLDSEPTTIQVNPLPKEGRLPGFTGAIGKFIVDPISVPTNMLRVGDPFQLAVTVRGQGNLARLVPPPPPRSRDWQLFPATTGGVAGQPVQLVGAVRLTFSMIPLTEEVTETPLIPFSYFDPEDQAYHDLTIPSVPVVVEGSEVAVDMVSLQAAAALAENTNKEPALSGLAANPGPASASLTPVQQRAWFPLVQIAPAILLLGLLLWDRRRRHLEQHPEILLRRRARRALRRERKLVQRAAAKGDEAGFAQATVRALRVACAPHYPAEPRALVSADVLPILDDSLRGSEAGLAVGRVFAAADAALFAGNGARAAGLVALKPAIDRALDSLEAKLRT